MRYVPKHECPPDCDCPDVTSPEVADRVRTLAGRVLDLLYRSNPDQFTLIWDMCVTADLKVPVVRFVSGDYYFTCSMDRWVRVSHINVDNTPGQLTIFTAWLEPDSDEGINYHIDEPYMKGLEDELNRLLVLDDLAMIE